MSFGRRGLKRMIPSSARHAPGDDREPEHEQRVREERAEHGRRRDDDLARGEREEDDEELGQVAERRLEHARRRPARNARRPTRSTTPTTYASPESASPETTKRDDRVGVREVEDAGDGGHDERRAEGRRAAH